MSVVRYTRFDGTGLKDDGYYCIYDAATNACYSDLVVYDGGLKAFTGKTPPGYDCSTIDLTAAGYDGTGLKSTTVYRQACIMA